ncbi:hypothetical protein GWC77_27155 [Paraburkholderia sp. NMBU_R16]|jgi:hypothetical protein|uniref:hypothetical protein n=1 Tax=Paraburkholderia sp. NMBU_R16 TaxID=2698676 RepID=UPI001565F1EE|nr:hypothetical protein [Paraburkholderia sp. NMBU_R16]NRO99548.1 hypothetical protein [Paraburkholderia sp. NMBU_R16]
MTRKPLLPSGCQRGLPFVVPDDWTPEQALAAFELLDDLLAVITDFYGPQLHDMLRERRSNTTTAPAATPDPPF